MQQRRLWEGARYVLLRPEETYLLWLLIVSAAFSLASRDSKIS
jgi:hypothetical protein